MDTVGNGKGKGSRRGASGTELEPAPPHRRGDMTEKQKFEDLTRRLEEADIPPGPRAAILDLWGSRNRWPAWERPRLDAEVERLIATYRRVRKSTGVHQCTVAAEVAKQPLPK